MNDPADHRFYLDEDVPVAVAVVGRGLGMDVVAAAEMGPLPKADGEHLRIAATSGRVMVTYNRNDFLDLTHATLAAGQPHQGVLILTRRLKRQGPLVAHALQRWSAGRLPMQPYEVDYLSG